MHASDANNAMWAGHEQALAWIRVSVRVLRRPEVFFFFSLSLRFVKLQVCCEGTLALFLFWFHMFDGRLAMGSYVCAGGV